MSNDTQIAETTRTQLGQVAMMLLGAHNLIAYPDALAFKFKGSKKANHVKIILDAGTDTYTLVFSKIWGQSFKQVTTLDGVYVDSLHSTIESVTGLYTSF